jgi:hypothetical protein
LAFQHAVNKGDNEEADELGFSHEDMFSDHPILVDSDELILEILDSDGDSDTNFLDDWRDNQRETTSSPFQDPMTDCFDLKDDGFLSWSPVDHQLLLSGSPSPTRFPDSSSTPELESYYDLMDYGDQLEEESQITVSSSLQQAPIDEYLAFDDEDDRFECVI